MKVWRKIIAVFLLFGILTNCFNYLVLSFSYNFNKTYIATVLCTNKNKPELHCNGKCFLDIKLKELTQKNKQEQENLKRIIETIAPTTTNLLAPIYATFIAVTVPFYLEEKPVKTAISIFQPPKKA